MRKTESQRGVQGHMSVRSELGLPDLGHSPFYLLKTRANQETIKRGYRLPSLLQEDRDVLPSGSREMA